MVKVTVIDAKDKQPLEGANLVYLDKDQIPMVGIGVTGLPDAIQSDANGDAYVGANPLIKYLKISFVGYKEKIVPAVTSTVTLESNTYTLGTADVTACRQYKILNDVGLCEFSWTQYVLDHKVIALVVVAIVAFIIYLLTLKHK